MDATTTTAISIPDDDDGRNHKSGLTAAMTLQSVAAIKALGEFIWTSGMAGANATSGTGALIAWRCLSDGITPDVFLQKYHIIDGRPSMKADVMLGEFRRRGGKFEWLDTGEKTGRAVLRGEFLGQTQTIEFSVDDAKAKGLIKSEKKQSNWVVWPAPMCRARCITSLVKILMPEIFGGIYTPEEQEEISEADRPRSVKATATSAAKPPKQPPAEEVVDAVTEPVGKPAASTTAAEKQAESEPAKPAAEPPKPPSTPPETTHAENAMLVEIQNFITSTSGANTTIAAFNAQMAKSKPEWPGLDNLKPEQLTKLLEAFRKKYPTKN